MTFTEITNDSTNYIYKNKKTSIEIPSMNLKSTGKITAIIPSSNPMTHTFTIKIEFNATSKVFPGMYAKVFIETK